LALASAKKSCAGVKTSGAVQTLELGLQPAGVRVELRDRILELADLVRVRVRVRVSSPTCDAVAGG